MYPNNRGEESKALDYLHFPPVKRCSSMIKCFDFKWKKRSMLIEVFIRVETECGNDLREKSLGVGPRFFKNTLGVGPRVSIIFKKFTYKINVIFFIHQLIC